ncbi:GNAT family N-acetyltransferase [Paenibacillus forsythiae]|nr:GNAT family N-acetyltransferase [Paenibacillus forsythiae]
MGIKIATNDDLQWVNEQYEQVGFVPSNLENETIAIVVHNDKYAGVGRIVYLNEEEAEIGGIYILDEFRGLSLAKELVGYLVSRAEQSGLRAVYCLPFEELRAFYEKFGFKEIDDEDQPINSLILKKHQWCKEKYEKRVLLLVSSSARLPGCRGESK